MKKSLLWCVIMLLSISMIVVFSLASCKKEIAPAKEEVVKEEKVTEVEQTKEVKKFEGQKLIVKVSPDLAMAGLKAKTEEFKKLYGVEVDYSEVPWTTWHTQGSQILATDEQVDVMGGGKDWWLDFPNKLVILNDYFSDLIPGMVDELVKYGTIGDNIYALPFLASNVIMFYNKEIFEKAGIEKIPETWDEFKDVIRKCNDYNGNYNYVTDWTKDGIYFAYAILLKSAGGELYEVKDKNIKFLMDSPESIETVKFMKGLIDEDLIPKDALTEIQQEVAALYSSGEIAMMQNWDMYAGFMEPALAEKTGFFAMPGKSQGLAATLDGHEFLMIPASSQNVELAAEYIRFIASYENTKQRCIEGVAQPIYKKQYEDQEVIAALLYLDVIEKVKSQSAEQFPPIKNSNELRQKASILHKALLGETSIEEALAEYQAFADTVEYIQPIE